MGELTGVLLAAGFGTRFGAHKLLARSGGRPLIAHSAAALTPCERRVAVVRGEDDTLQRELQAIGIACIVNPQPTRGMGYSIACAVRATSGSTGWCILPADMPWVRVATTGRIVEALRGGALLAAPFYRGRRGHPVGFAARFEQELSRLDGDAGGRLVLHRHAEALTAIATDDPGVLRDVDSPSDL
jgi:molybdenum cofactor cytidylyltransferase